MVTARKLDKLARKPEWWAELLPYMESGRLEAGESEAGLDSRVEVSLCRIVERRGIDRMVVRTAEGEGLPAAAVVVVVAELVMAAEDVDFLAEEIKERGLGGWSSMEGAGSRLRVSSRLGTYLFLWGRLSSFITFFGGLYEFGMV